ncbi:MAG: peptidoglycan DD-metalloendopeptidase family protein [Bacteroidaceae bacterium]|nr:peptidoglycan DD-metalloendopeptidase family protein [Bacteroidaceae bacterium]MBR1755040.1 peptidoglycan DD-metalloendopeptidase family protein [Bacteroidaceae bacterium]
MLNLFIQRTAAALAFVACLTPAMGQDLIARQAPVDKKMRAVDSVEIQRLFEQENLTNPGEDLYPSWEDSYINMYGNVPLPSEFKIDLRNFCMPTTNRIVTSRYGYRPRFRRQHKGLDINAYKGDTIRAAFDGKVRVVTFQRGGYGNVVVIRHANGLETVYGHLSKHLTKPDKIVKAGDPIGLAGSTGRSTGTHLHFETRLLGEYIDPSKLFDFEHQDVTGDYYVFKGRGRGVLLGKHDANHATAEGDVAQAEEAVTYQSSETAQSSRNSRAARNTRIHKVRSGETLSSIARKRHTTVAKLCRANGITTKTKLRIGQILRYS